MYSICPYYQGVLGNPEDIAWNHRTWGSPYGVPWIRHFFIWSRSWTFRMSNSNIWSISNSFYLIHIHIHTFLSISTLFYPTKSTRLFQISTRLFQYPPDFFKYPPAFFKLFKYPNFGSWTFSNIQPDIFNIQPDIFKYPVRHF